MSRRRPPTVHGFLVVDKPRGMTSHDCVALVRRRLGERRVGHAGTLDPSATGVLLIGVGNATRLLTFLVGHTKRYTAEVVLGIETNTLDADGEITARHDMGGVTLDDVRAAVSQHLVGNILQIPPMVSAIKVDGRRLHELAREGVEVERAPRPVTVSRFDVDAGAEPGVFLIDVTCSSGTYVRTLAADLGRLLGGGAHLRNLRRVASGGFAVDEAAPPEVAPLRPARDALRGMAEVVVDDDTAAMVRNGRVLPRWEGDGPWAVVGTGGEVLAVYEAHGEGMAKPAVVIGL